MPLDLAARCLRHAVGPHQHDRLDGEFMLGRQSLADCLEGGRHLGGLPLAALDLRHHGHPLATIHVDGEGGDRTGPHERARLLDGMLDVLRVVVAAADNDQVFEPAGHEEFTVVEEAQVAGAEIGPRIGLPRGHSLIRRRLIGLREHRPEGGRGGVATVPVALCHARAAHPDLTDATRRQRLARLRVDDQHVLAIEFAAAANQPPHRRRIGRPHHGGAGLDRGRVERPDHRRLELHAAGHHQRALGEAVAGIERLTAESARRKGLAEGVDRLGPHRLGAVEGQRPAREIERGPLLRRGLPHAEFVGEVGAAADGGPVFRDGLEPPQRLLQEGDRRHEHVELAAIERHENSADQAHVVEARQPKHARLAPRDLEGLHDPQRVVEQVFVREHHALRRAGRAARVLQEGEGAAIDVGAFPAIGPGDVEFAVDLPDQVFEARGRGPQGIEPVDHVAGGEGDGGLGISGDRLDPLDRAVFSGRVGGHGDRPAVETAHEGRDEVEAGWIEQEHPLARHPLAQEPGAQRPGFPVEFGVGDVEFFVLAVHEEREGPVVGAVGRPLPQQVHDRRSNRSFSVGVGDHGLWSLPPMRARNDSPSSSLEGATGISAGSSRARHSLSVWPRQPEVSVFPRGATLRFTVVAAGF